MNAASVFPKDELRRFTRLIMMLINEFDANDAPPSPILLKELEQSLIVSFLVGHQHNFSHFLEKKPADIAPWQVRRVEQLIEANWDQPLTIERLAATIDAGVRSIQHAFKKSRGYSPMEFLRKIRLKHARSMLEAAESSLTVTDVAFACGFGNLGHFSSMYMDEFHELPSVTLARAKGGGR